MSTGGAGLGEIARTMAEVLRAKAGDGWSVATMQVRHTGPSFSSSAWTDVRDYVGVNDHSVFEMLWKSPPSVLEVRLLGTGEYTFSASPEIATVSTDRVIFDSDFLFPEHPLPGMPRPASAEPTGAPTDPVVLAEVVRLTGEFAELYAALKGHAPPWLEACTEEALSAAEARIGARLPEETGLLGRYSHYGLDWLVDQHLEERPGSYGWKDGLDDDDGVVFESVPFGTVKRLSRNDWWVTFGSDRAMNYLAVDLDPAERGRVGQVIEYGRDVHGPLRFVSGSITDMLTEVTTALRAGEYEDEGEGEVYVDAQVGFTSRVGRGHRETIQDVSTVDLPAELAVLPQPGLVQELYVNDPADLDLAVLDDLTSLRALMVNRGQVITPSIGGLEALESLRVSARRVDLAALAGHPTLWDLNLDGVTEPVDVSLLRALPRLTRLNLAGATALNLELVGELPSLRVLTLDVVQVRYLLGSGRPLPKLAALFVTGRTDLRDMAELAVVFSDGRVRVAVTTFSGVLS